MIEFIQKFFIAPIYEGTGYNVYNTIVYGLLLGVGIIISDKLLKRLGVAVDKDFYIATLPFLTLASFLRALVDANLLPISFFLVTPGIFFVIFLTALVALLISKKIEKRGGVKYSNLLFLMGSILTLYPIWIVVTNIYAIKPLLYTLLTTLVSSAVLVYIFRWLKITRKEILLMGAAHMLDASATFVGVDFFGYWEEHVFENFLIQLTGTALVIFPLKIIVLLVIIAILEKIEDNSFWYYAMFLLGYAPGLRDTLKIILLG